MQNKEKQIISGVVVEALPDTLFKVKLDQGIRQGDEAELNEGKELLCYLAGKMRVNRIRVLIGDRVAVEIDPYGGKGRIIKRG